ncbi:MAG TPA: RNA polymerase subunit sigma-24 [Ruminococcus sp.]|nr:RNA polymerase subunit sigma-24 [Ruminococcus sp.]
MKSESELRSLISRSRKEGFRNLFRQYHGYVYAIVWNHISKVGSHEDAEECVSDVFTDIFLQFDQIEEGKLQSYIRTVSKRKSINYFHRLTAKPLSISMDEPEAETAVSGENIEQDYDKTVLRRILLDKVKLLGEPDTTIIMMKYYYDYKPDEIAESVHLNRTAVRKRLSRAMKRLAKLLEEEGYTVSGGE